MSETITMADYLMEYAGSPNTLNNLHSVTKEHLDEQLYGEEVVKHAARLIDRYGVPLPDSLADAPDHVVDSINRAYNDHRDELYTWQFVGVRNDPDTGVEVTHDLTDRTVSAMHQDPLLLLASPENDYRLAGSMLDRQSTAYMDALLEAYGGDRHTVFENHVEVIPLATPEIPSADRATA